MSIRDGHCTEPVGGHGPLSPGVPSDDEDALILKVDAASHTKTFNWRGNSLKPTSIMPHETPLPLFRGGNEEPGTSFHIGRARQRRYHRISGP